MMMKMNPLLTPFEPLARPLLFHSPPTLGPPHVIPRGCRPNWQEELATASQGWARGSAGGFIFFCYQVFAWLRSFFCIQSSNTMKPSRDMTTTTTTTPKKLSANNPWLWRKLSLSLPLVSFAVFVIFEPHSALLIALKVGHFGLKSCWRKSQALFSVCVYNRSTWWRWNRRWWVKKTKTTMLVKARTEDKICFGLVVVVVKNCF